MTNQGEIFQKCVENDVTFLSETFVEDGDEIFLEIPRGFSYIASPAIPSTDVNAVRASGGFGVLFNCNRVRIVPNEFRSVGHGIFYGPVHLTDESKVYVISVYGTKNAGSSVFDEHFYDHLDDIISSLQGQNIIIGGDFNAKLGDLTGALGLVDDAEHLMPQRATCSAADDAGAQLLSAMMSHDVHGLYDAAQGSVRETFRCWSGKGTSMIDYVFVNRDLLPSVHNYTNVFHHPSNHSMLTVTLSLLAGIRTPRNEPEPRRGERKLRLFNLDKLQDLEHTEGIRRLAVSTEGFTVSSALDAVLEFVSEYTEEVVISRPDKAQRAPGDTVRAVRAARRTERRLRKEGNETVRQSLRELWCKQVAEWRKLRDRDSANEVKEARARFFEAVRNRNMHRAWKIARRKLPGKGGGISRSATDALSQADWEAHFANLFNRTGGDGLTEPSAGRRDAILDAPFTAEEVQGILESKKCHRSLGPDGFSVDHLRVLRYDAVTCSALANFFNLCVSCADVPEIWDHAFLHILYKGKGPMDDADSFRGITLKSQLLKTLESLLCSRLRTWAEVNEKLPAEQVAYRPGKVGSEHLFSLTVLREQARVRKIPLFAAFVDIKKAFPSVNRQRMLNKLSEDGVSDQFLRILTRLYSRLFFTPP